MDAYGAQLQFFDPDITNAVSGEERRQAEGVEMIPSENYTYPEVLAALGSVLTKQVLRRLSWPALLSRPLPEEQMTARPIVLGVFVSDKHSFNKYRRESINLLERLGVEGDAHCGKLVQHLWDAKKDPLRPNFRQVHLIHSELLDEVNARGFNVLPGDLGENITTRGIDLLGLPTGARLQIGEDAVVEVTGLRSPCVQINTFQEGLLEAVIERRKGVGLIRKTGVMSVVIRGGVIRNGDAIEVRLPDGPHEPLAPV
jgi:MOSC domain-containing protein YiiM